MKAHGKQFSSQNWAVQGIPGVQRAHPAGPACMQKPAIRNGHPSPSHTRDRCSHQPKLQTEALPSPATCGIWPLLFSHSLEPFSRQNTTPKHWRAPPFSLPCQQAAIKVCSTVANDGLAKACTRCSPLLQSLLDSHHSQSKNSPGFANLVRNKHRHGPLTCCSPPTTTCTPKTVNGRPHRPPTTKLMVNDTWLLLLLRSSLQPSCWHSKADHQHHQSLTAKATRCHKSTHCYSCCQLSHPQTQETYAPVQGASRRVLL